MTPALPSLESPAPGSTCPRCAEPLNLIGWCYCGWRGNEAREAAIRADLEDARKRARAWQLGRGVSA